ncbi:MAG TPA: type III secretion protein, partial [Planctomycetaceae bacterium]|nr:type III secretion protein [Planctomycetaceae bacterium]
AFTLVLVRLSGLMVVGPIFGQAVVPANVRVLLVVALSVLVAPLLHDQTRIGFERLDANRDGRLTLSEVPPQLQSRFQRLARAAGQAPETARLTRHQFYGPPQIPATLLQYARQIACEFALGFVLGLGVLTIFSGLQLAGQIIDQQTGLVLGEIFNPGLELEGSLSGQFLYLFGVAAFLVATPLNGHLMVVSALLETFQTVPVGDAIVLLSTADLVRNVVHQSFVLAIQVAAPVLATMSLIALAMGFLGHTVPQINILVVGFAVRAMLSLLVLAASMAGIGYEVADQALMVVDWIHTALTGLP